MTAPPAPESAVPVHEIEVPLGPPSEGVTLRCRVAGPEGAPVLLFLHGFPEAAFVWDGLLAHFGRRWRCVAPNLRGYAGSSAPAEVGAYRARHLVGDLVALLAVVSPQRPLEALVAHDWGGAIAWNLAIQRPALMRRLVIVNSPHPGALLRQLRDDPAQREASAYMNFLCRPDAAALLRENDFARLWPFFELAGGAPWLTPDLRERYRAAWNQGLEGPLNWYRASPLRPPTEADPGVAGMTLDDDAWRVGVPTRVVWGLEDHALLPGLVHDLGRWIGDLTLTTVPGASHWIVHERPGLVAAEIEAALAS
jgi:pimeloyl-ACP methyl ester carboxylesterase